MGITEIMNAETMNDKKEEKLIKIADKISRCRKCRLWKSRIKTVPGEGPADSDLFFVGEAPGKEEDESGRPFVGRSGRLLTNMLNKVGIDRSKIFITSILKCRPPHNRKPRKDEIENCIGYLIEQLEVIKPKVIVLLGLVAIECLIGNHRNLREMHGKNIEKDGKIYFITYHPAAARRSSRVRRIMEEDLKKLKKMMD